MRRRTSTIPAVAVGLALLAGVLASLVVSSAVRPVAPARAAGVSVLSRRLAGSQARSRSLAGAIGSLSSAIAGLDAQVTALRGREAAVRTELAADREALVAVRAHRQAEAARAVRLNARLVQARSALSAALVSGYESDRPDLMRVVLESHGFAELVERIDFLHRALTQRRTIIRATRLARRLAADAATRLAHEAARRTEIVRTMALRSAALAGMDSLLAGRQAALDRARAVQRAALAAERARSSRLRRSIRAQEAAAAAAARAAARAAPPPPAGALGSSAGWAIPYAIVLCESGGQNLPPNQAGASGYYQIIPATWSSFGGPGPAAWLAAKSVQDAVAARIYRGGVGVSNWDCARIVGLTR